MNESEAQLPESQPKLVLLNIVHLNIQTQKQKQQLEQLTIKECIEDAREREEDVKCSVGLKVIPLFYKNGTLVVWSGMGWALPWGERLGNLLWWRTWLCCNSISHDPLAFESLLGWKTETGDFKC